MTTIPVNPDLSRWIHATGTIPRVDTENLGEPGRLRLLMVVAANGLLSRYNRDNMAWPGGQLDKALFRLLTLGDEGPLLAGRETAELLPVLRHRRVIPLSRDPDRGTDLHEAARRWPTAWLLGGPSVATRALQDRLVDRVLLVWLPHQVEPVDETAVFYQDTIGPLLPTRPTEIITLRSADAVRIASQHGPVEATVQVHVYLPDDLALHYLRREELPTD